MMIVFVGDCLLPIVVNFMTIILPTQTGVESLNAAGGPQVGAWGGVFFGPHFCPEHHRGPMCST